MCLEVKMEQVFANQTINTVILSYIMNGTETWNYSMIRRIYRIFGKAHEYQYFLECTRNYFFNDIFRRYKVKDIYGFLRRKLKNHFNKQLHAYNTFVGAFNNNYACVCIDWISNKAQRSIARYLALYYGYLYLCVQKIQYNLPGDAFERIHESIYYKNQVIKYEFLRRHYIHNLAYYDLIIDSPSQDKRAYRLKRDVSIKGVGITVDCQLVDCIKVLYNR